MVLTLTGGLGGTPMRSQIAQSRSPAPFPVWLGPLWLFLVFIEKGYDWASLFLYGIVPWLGAWAIWRLLARTRYLREISTTAVDQIWLWASRMIWVAVVILMGGIYYVNHYLPRGPFVYTGEVVCENDDRGPCGEQRVEDIRGLRIPDWARFLKTSEAQLLLYGLVFGGIVASARPKGGYGKKAEDHSL